MTKYDFDERWIYHDLNTGINAHGKKFALYTAMGLITDAIFWVTATVFRMIWRIELMREFRAIIGLSIGYVTKYQLDRRYVFLNRSPELVP